MEESLRAVALAIVRFAAFGANALLFGLVPVLLLVVRPAFASLPGPEFDPGRRRIAGRLEGFVQAALWGALVAAVLAVVLQAIVVSEFASGGDVSGRSLLAVFETSFGRWYAARLPLLAVLGVMLARRVRTSALAGAGDGRAGPAPVWWAAWTVTALLLLATSSFSGHAAVAVPRAPALVNDVVHLAAGATWFAGIVVLAVVLPDGWRGDGPDRRLALMRPVVTRFSNLALVSIGVVLLTGVINSLLHVGAPGHLVTTSYGLALSTKLALFLLILVLGGINRFVVRRRLVRDLDAGRDAPRIFRRAIAAELVVALGIMAATSVLTGLSRTRRDAPAPDLGDGVTSEVRWREESNLR